MNSFLFPLAFLVLFISLLGFFGLWIKYIREDNKLQKEKLAQAEADIEKVKKQTETYTQEKKENEELIQKVNSGNDIDSFNASIDLLQKQSEKGKHRNN